MPPWKLRQIVREAASKYMPSQDIVIKRSNSRVKMYQVTPTSLRVLDMDEHYRELGIEFISDLDEQEGDDNAQD